VNEANFPFPVPDQRFEQRNEMFKRRIWDTEFVEPGRQLYDQVKFQEKYGYRKLDYALRNAAWNIEYDFAMGNMCANQGMYSWTRVADKARRFVETGGPVSATPAENSRQIKKAARFFGADLVGICPIHPNLIYANEFDLLKMEQRPLELPAACRHAVVMAVAMGYDACRYSPDAISGAATGLGYSRQAVLANLMAAFIRGLGFQAIPCGNDTALSVPLAMAAGLGELGRNGLLISEKYGPRVRLCKVFTNLPLEHDAYRPFGVQKFCRTCKKCAKKCPAQAISYAEPTCQGPSLSNHSGVAKWYIHPEKCFLFWVKNWLDCNGCIQVCPFNKPAGPMHNVARFFIRHLPLLDRLLVRLDDICGYGSPLPARKKNFW
jgi:reductive dehalogenase